MTSGTTLWAGSAGSATGSVWRMPVPEAGRGWQEPSGRPRRIVLAQPASQAHHTAAPLHTQPGAIARCWACSNRPSKTERLPERCWRLGRWRRPDASWPRKGRLLVRAEDIAVRTPAADAVGGNGPAVILSRGTWARRCGSDHRRGRGTVGQWNSTTWAATTGSRRRWGRAICVELRLLLRAWRRVGKAAGPTRRFPVTGRRRQAQIANAAKATAARRKRRELPTGGGAAPKSKPQMAAE